MLDESVHGVGRDGIDRGRRAALQYAAYTAPAMAALLLSSRAMAASSANCGVGNGGEPATPGCDGGNNDNIDDSPNG